MTMQTDPTLLANNTQHCLAQQGCDILRRLHGTTKMLALVAYCLKPVKLLGPCKLTDATLLAMLGVVGTCCVSLHGP